MKIRKERTAKQLKEVLSVSMATPPEFLWWKILKCAYVFLIPEFFEKGKAYLN